MKRTVKVKDMLIGGENPVSIQSMTNTKTTDAEASLKQIMALEDAGSQIVRLSVPDIESALALKEIRKHTNIPLVADIHYDYQLAVMSAENGADKIRINPGNIGGTANVKYLAEFLRERKIPIRIGVNSGSLEKDIYDRYGNTGRALAESALRHVGLLEQCGFYDIIISAKSSSVRQTVEAYRELDRACDYPLHLGVTEAGIDETGIIKSSIGIGALLLEGIGNTIRVSLTGNPVREVIAARRILSALNLGGNMPEIISCPTCARTVIDVEKLAKEIEKRFINARKHIKIAVMGCVVNGPGEAKECDIGVAGGKERSAIFVKGKIVKTVDNKDLMDELIKRTEELING